MELRGTISFFSKLGFFREQDLLKVVEKSFDLTEFFLITRTVCCDGHTVEIMEIYSHAFLCKNSVKVTDLLKKLLNS